MTDCTFLPSMEDLCHLLSLNKAEDIWQVSAGSEVRRALTNVEENAFAPPLCTDGIF